MEEAGHSLYDPGVRDAVMKAIADLALEGLAIRGTRTMPLAGKGHAADVDEYRRRATNADFNRWYDREHLEERVAIDGFLEARRYVAHAANPKYLSLYSTETLDVLDSPAYRARLASQTDWSRRNMARFKNMLRGVARITISTRHRTRRRARRGAAAADARQCRRVA